MSRSSGVTSLSSLSTSGGPEYRLSKGNGAGTYPLEDHVFRQRLLQHALQFPVHLLEVRDLLVAGQGIRQEFTERVYNGNREKQKTLTLVLLCPEGRRHRTGPYPVLDELALLQDLPLLALILVFQMAHLEESFPCPAFRSEPYLRRPRTPSGGCPVC